jgi:hypothetical protein
LSAARPELIVLLQIEAHQSKIHSRIKAFLQKYLPLRFRLPENELAEMGVAAGAPLSKKILDAYFYATLEGKLKSRSDQTRFLKKMAEASGQKKEEKQEEKKVEKKTLHAKGRKK